MSKGWGGIGAWAAETERADAEERERQSAAADITQAESQSFPSLKAAAAAKPKKKKAISLSEFTTGTHVGPGGASRFDSSNRLTTEEMMKLPTGPKERSPDEIEPRRFGGGFSSFSRSGPPPRRSDEGDAPWGGAGRRSYGSGFDDERQAPPRRGSEYDQPSRADEVDNWATTKKPISYGPVDSTRNDRDRYSTVGTGGSSRADEVDSWASAKKPFPARSTFSSGFRDSAADRERPRLVLDKPRGDAVSTESTRSTKPTPFGAARPREEVLAEKGLDWRKFDSDIDTKKMSRPTSSQSSRPSSAQSSRPESPAGTEVAPKPRPKINPFGDAKPREVLLKEQGKDWRKMDFELEHRRVDRPETEEEKMLKEEINHLKRGLAKESQANANGESADKSGSLHEELLHRERDLELLTRELDDKIRFGQRVPERPGSGAGRVGSGLPERPPSQSGKQEDSGSMEFMDRPRSRGTADTWSRGDDRRGAGFQGRDRGFIGNKDLDRSKSKDRW
ncbi:eukaryotic translation initiation factor 4B1-like [Aristolochia californica]|uniref:eukaryotic translation initiation factor 4B1-like n=1 Tax=Aristolochia californica TaxID=171875 RepID=UPI0035D79234